MASINTIAKEWADEIRDGIAWVIVWKTGRSWNAEAVWLSSTDDTYEPEDLQLARKIIEEDPKAVMLNGYYCGRLGESMTVAELATGIRWHYENGCNLLIDSIDDCQANLIQEVEESDIMTQNGAIKVHCARKERNDRKAFSVMDAIDGCQASLTQEVEKSDIEELQKIAMLEKSDRSKVQSNGKNKKRYESVGYVYSKYRSRDPPQKTR